MKISRLKLRLKYAYLILTADSFALFAFKKDRIHASISNCSKQKFDDGINYFFQIISEESALMEAKEIIKNEHKPTGL